MFSKKHEPLLAVLVLDTTSNPKLSRIKENAPRGRSGKALSLILGALILGLLLAAGSEIHGSGNAHGVRNVEASNPTTQIIVKFKSSASPSAIYALNGSMAVQEVDSIPALGLRILRVGPNQDASTVAARYSRHPLVAFAEADALVKPEALPNDPSLSQQWHLTKIQAPGAWDRARASNVLIGICDTGVASVPDLSPVLRGDLGRNVVDNTTNWNDNHGHGTSVAGAAAAATNNNLGVAGVAWGAQIIPIRISNLTDGSAYASDAAKCVSYAADHGARVINVSYLMANSLSLDLAGQYAQERGAITVVAAGNNGLNQAWPDLQGFIAVSATTGNDSLAGFSNYGPFVDVSAPGVSILTTNKNGGVSSVSGTSLAAPITSGTIALIFGADPSLSAGGAQSILFANTDDAGSKGWDIQHGNGRINAAKVVAATIGGGGTTATPIPTGTATLGSPTPTASAPRTATPSPTPTATPTPGDAIPPVVTISNPVASVGIRGNVTIMAAATDNVAMARVDFYVDGVLIRSDSGAPYSTPWNTRQWTNGSHTVTAVAFDSAGNSSTDSLVVSVTN